MLESKSFDCLLRDANNSFGDRVFLADVDLLGNISYAEVLQFASGLSRRLDLINVPRGAPVATIFHNCGLAALIFLAVIASRRVFVPLNPTSTQEELDYMLDKAECSVVILDPTHTRSANFGQRVTERVLDHTQYFREIAALYSHSNLSNESTSHTFVGEIVYTSGSTGRPKGVVLSEKSLLENAYALAAAYQVTNDDRFLTVCPLFHNSGQVFTTLSCIIGGGSTSVVKSDIGMLRFWHYVDKHRAHWSLGMVSFLALLLARSESPGLSTEMKGLLTGGSAIDAGLVQRFEARFGVQVRTVYGLTESASIATCEFVDPSPRSVGSSGRPLPMCDVRIGNDVCNLAARNELASRDPGEIWIQGPTIFDRYVGDPQLTLERKHEGWLRTGDLGYFDEHGNLFVIDRLDSMLIVGGENVYPAEVEKHCGILPGAAQVVLTAVDDDIWGKKLILVYKSEQDAQSPIKSWHKILVQKVAAFKLPQAYISIREIGLDDFPRKDNGKLDRPALFALLKSRYSKTA